MSGSEAAPRPKRQRSIPSKYSEASASSTAQENSIKLNKTTTNGSQGEKLPISWQLSCHRAAPTKATSRRAGDDVLVEGSAAADSEEDLPGDAKPRRSKKVGCPFILKAELVVNSQGGVDVLFTEHNGHFFHTPGDAADLHWLQPDSDIKIKVGELLDFGLKPMRIKIILDTATQRSLGLGEGNLLGALCGRRTLQLRDIENIRKTRVREQRLSDSDVEACEILVKQLCSIEGSAHDDYVLYYTHDAATKRLELALSTPFQRRMLAAFGRELVFMDAVFGMNQYGYALLTLLVRDDFGNGVPVAFCISDAEDKERWLKFVSKAFQAAEVDYSKVTVMIDKSVVERAALADLGICHQYCIFHMFQDGERFLKSADSGVHGRQRKDVRLDILHRWRKLQRITDEAAFKVESAAFVDFLKSKGFEHVVEYYGNNWESDAKHWAAWARGDIAHLASDTNNLIERFFGLLKYVFCDRKVCKRLDDLIKLLMFTVVPHYIRDRAAKLSGNKRTQAVAVDARYEWEVGALAGTPGRMMLINKSIGLFRATSMNHKSSDQYKACVGDISCECMASGDDVCKHLAAAHKVAPYSKEMVMATAEKLKKEGMYEPMQNTKPEQQLFVCKLVADPSSNRRIYVNGLDMTCTCHASSKFDVCCHLVAITPEDEVEEFLDGRWPSELKYWRRDRYVELQGPDPLGDNEELGKELEGLQPNQKSIMSGKRAEPWRSAVRIINENMRFVPEQEQAVAAAKLDSLAEYVKEAARPYKEFTLTNKSAGKKLTKQWKRKETERAYSAKFPDRNNGRKAQVQQKRKFSKGSAQPGKERTETRGIGKANRAEKRGYKRKSRKKNWDENQ